MVPGGQRIPHGGKAGSLTARGTSTGRAGRGWFKTISDYSNAGEWRLSR
jgi:hypothetical protein